MNNSQSKPSQRPMSPPLKLIEKARTVYSDAANRLNRLYEKSSLTFYLLQIAIIITLLMLTTFIVYLTGGTGFAYPYLLLIPIILANAWFKLTGGIFCAIIAGLLLGPLMPLNVTEGITQSNYNWLARLIMFVIISCFVGTVFQQLRKSMSTDNRTNLPNYKALHQDVRRALLHLRISRSLNKEPMIMIVIIRLIDLWEVTEAFGIKASDRAIELLASELHKQNEHINQVYNFSGSELALLVTAGAEEDHNKVRIDVLTQIQNAGEQNIVVEGTDVRIQLSAGSYINTNPHIDPEILIRRARSGLITALEMEEFHHAFEITDDQRFNNRIQLISRVRAALAANEFELFFQPKINLITGEDEGCEGLIRWADGDGGYIPPGAFMPKVESTTLITPVTRQVVHLACAFIKRNPQPVTVSINWAARNLLDELLIEWLADTVMTYGIDPAHLEIEITEGALINNPEQARENVKRLRRMGFPVSLDDFGTGYSSFQYLTQLPITGLKIDRAFVINLENNSTAQKVMKGMIDLAHTLNLKVTVEGLETQGQCDIVSSLGADYGQGYYLARPLAEHLYMDYLKRPDATDSKNQK